MPYNNNNRSNRRESRGRTASGYKIQKRTNAEVKEGMNVLVVGTFVRTTFRNDDTNFVIATLQPTKMTNLDTGEPIHGHGETDGTHRKGEPMYDQLVCKGTMPSYTENGTFKLDGRIVDDGTYGIQMTVHGLEAIVPTGAAELANFIKSRVANVGNVKAEKIVAALGENAYETLTQHPEKLRDLKIKGVSKKNIEDIIDIVPGQIEDIKAVGYLSSIGLSTTTINAIMHAYPSDTVLTVQKDPYVLTKVKGFGFTRADDIAKKFGIGPEDPRRVRGGVYVTIQWLASTRGYTVVPESVLLPIVYEKLNLDPERMAKVVRNEIANMLQIGEIIEIPEGYQSRSLNKAEGIIKKCLERDVRGTRPLVPRAKLDQAIEAEQKALGFNLTDDQLKATYSIFGNDMLTILTGGAGAGKAVLTKEFIWKYDKQNNRMIRSTMGQLKVGDYVLARDGLPTKVVGVFPQGKLDAYQITFADGRQMVCSADHIWTVYKMSHGKYVTCDMTVRDMLSRGVMRNDNRMLENEGTYRESLNFAVPVTSPVMMPEMSHNDDIDPYVLGVCLGDGCLTDSDDFTISSNDKPLIAEIASLLHCATPNNHRNGNSWIFECNDEQRQGQQKFYNNDYDYKILHTDYVMRHHPKLCATANNKFVPEEYKTGSIGQRLAIIQGLMDTAGTIQRGDGSYNVSLPSTSKQLLLDVQEILYSLGIISNIREYDRRGQTHYANSKSYVSKSIEYTLHIKCSNEDKHHLFRACHHKVQLAEEATQHHEKHHYDFVGIADIQKLDRQEEMVCIGVDAPDSLFLIGRDFTVTHNTSAIKMVTQVAARLGIPYCLCSPTGKAAKRLSEACTPDDSKNPLPAYTLHRALGIGMSHDDRADLYSEEEANIIEDGRRTAAMEAFDKARIVMCDEVSMLDTSLAARLLDKCTKGNKHLLMIGDPNQLPSVGPGSILADFLACPDIPSVRLTKIFRQAQGSPVIMAANAVLSGQDPCIVPGVEFHECIDEDVLDTLDKFVMPRLSKEHLGYQDIAFMSPMKRRTVTSGVAALNNYLRPKMNGAFRDMGSQNSRLQTGDFVTQTKNNYQVDKFNGDQGRIIEVESNGSVIVEYFDTDEQVEYTMSESLDNLQLAYASTIHRYQGSQCDTVVMILTDSHYIMCTRNLLYTGITRAAKRIILIGNESAFKRAAKNKTEMFRYTGLKNLDLTHGQQRLDII